jgi:hypothetical protein
VTGSCVHGNETSGSQNENEMDRTFSTHGIEEECIQVIDRKA